MAFDSDDLISDITDQASAPIREQLADSIAPLYDLAADEVKDVAGEYLAKAVGAEALQNAERVVNVLADPAKATPALANQLLAGALPAPARLLLGNQPLEALSDPAALLENPADLAGKLANHALNTALPPAARLILGDNPLEALSGNPLEAVQKRIQGFTDQLSAQWDAMQKALENATDTAPLEQFKPIATHGLAAKLEAAGPAAPIVAAIADTSNDAKPADLVCLPCKGTQAKGIIAESEANKHTSAGGETKTKDNRIDIVFDPDKSSKIKKCEKIVHIQFRRGLADGKMINPGKYSVAHKHKEAITTMDGWAVDCLPSEVTPDYQQGVGDGKKNGASTKATISDAPQTAGGDKGFYHPTNNPTGWKTYKLEFVAFAYCMKGGDCGKWYEGVQWEYSKTWEEHRDGKKGESKIINNNVTSEPTKSQLEALEKFNKAKGFKPCK